MWRQHRSMQWRCEWDVTKRTNEDATHTKDQMIQRVMDSYRVDTSEIHTIQQNNKDREKKRKESKFLNVIPASTTSYLIMQSTGLLKYMSDTFAFHICRSSHDNNLFL